MFICAIFVSGCTGFTGAEPTVKPTIVYVPSTMPTPTATIAPTIMPTATATATPTPEPTATPTAFPTYDPAPIYTMSCTFTHIEMNTTDTVITGIRGSLTDINSGNSIVGMANNETYRFPDVPAGVYDLEVDVQYTIYYANNSTADRNTTITDRFELNGNVDKTYPLS